MSHDVANAVNQGFSELVEVINDTNPLFNESYMSNEDGVLHLPWYYLNVILYYMNGTVKIISRRFDEPIMSGSRSRFFPLRNRSAYNKQILNIIDSRIQLNCTSELHLPRLMMFVDMSKLMFDTNELFNVHDSLINVKTQLMSLIYKGSHLHTLEKDAFWADETFEAMWRMYSS